MHRAAPIPRPRQQPPQRRIRPTVSMRNFVNQGNASQHLPIVEEHFELNEDEFNPGQIQLLDDVPNSEVPQYLP